MYIIISCDYSWYTELVFEKIKLTATLGHFKMPAARSHLVYMVSL